MRVSRSVLLVALVARRPAAIMTVTVDVSLK
jgi:hypothetical protein